MVSVRSGCLRTTGSSRRGASRERRDRRAALRRPRAQASTPGLRQSRPGGRDRPASREACDHSGEAGVESRDGDGEPPRRQ